MATTDAVSTPLAPEIRLGLTVFALGAFGALGSLLVALGVTDVLAYADGYRTGHWVVASYLRAFAVTGAGWSLLVAVMFGTVRTALASR
jgi:apolipoprotein N-acyltransferase